MSRKAERVIGIAFVLIGLFIGGWLLYRAGPGWDAFRPTPATPTSPLGGGGRGGLHKTTGQRIWMFAGGAFFTGGAVYSMIRIIAQARDRRHR